MKIKIVDDMAPEDVAMLQALYSRSPAPVEEHLKKVKKSGAGAFMEQYYVGYNHKSIGDGGTTTLFIEGVSMLAAKAIQDWALYSGTEASTRYMDFGNGEAIYAGFQPEDSRAQELYRMCFDLYRAALDAMLEELPRRYPRQEGQKEKTWKRAIRARAFDVARSFLPAGAKTNLSWSTNLRQASDHLDGLECHPLKEVCDIANAMRQALIDRYPHSFRINPVNSESATIADWAYRIGVGRGHYLGALDGVDVKSVTVDFSRFDGVQVASIPLDRPRGRMIPRRLIDAGTIQSEFGLDFGSFRDLQRHRNGLVRMPYLTTQHGFHPWYLEQLSSSRHLIEDVLGTHRLFLEGTFSLFETPYFQQYYVPMGYVVPCRVTQSLPALVYRLELRSSKMVHPTLRAVVQEEAKQLQATFPDLELHIDTSPSDWDVRRGEQTIEAR